MQQSHLNAPQLLRHNKHQMHVSSTLKAFVQTLVLTFGIMVVEYPSHVVSFRSSASWRVFAWIWRCRAQRPSSSRHARPPASRLGAVVYTYIRTRSQVSICQHMREVSCIWFWSVFYSHAYMCHVSGCCPGMDLAVMRWPQSDRGRCAHVVGMHD